MSWTVWSRCKWCERIHGPPRCEPPAESVTPVTVTEPTEKPAPLTNAQRQAAYRERHREAVRAYDRQRKAKRAAD